MIFQNLDSYDLQSTRETCKKFKAVIDGSKELSQKLNEDPRSNFELMPIEILERIFSNLPSADICNVAATCRTFSSIISSSDKLSKTLTLYLRYPKDVNQFMSDISNSNRQFKSLSINRVREATRLSDQLVSQAKKDEFYEFMRTNLGPDIENLSISWRNPSNIRDMNYTMELQRILQPIQRRMLAANEHLHRMPLHILLHYLENNVPFNAHADPAFEFEG